MIFNIFQVKVADPPGLACWLGEAWGEALCPERLVRPPAPLIVWHQPLVK